MADFTVASKIVPPAPVDPLTLASGIQNLQKGQLSNKLLGQNIEQTLAQRAAAKASIDPDTGQTDPRKYISALAGGGGSPEALLQAQQQLEAQVRTSIASQNLSQQELATSALENGNAVQLAQSVLASGDTSKDGVVKTLDSMAPTMFKSATAQQQLEAFKSQLTDDPVANKALVQQFALQHGTVAKVLGEIGAHDVGPNIVQGRTDPVTGGFSTTAVIGKGLSPSEAQTPAYTYTDADTGQTHIVTKAEAARAAAGNGGTQPGAPPKGIVSGMKIGDPERAGQGVKFENDLTTAAHSWGDVHGTLSNFSGLVNQLASGPKVGAIKTLGQIAAQFGVAPPSVKNDTAALEEAGKLAYQIAQRQFQQLGGTGTDSKLDSAMHTSPSEFLTQQGNKRIIPLLQGNNDAIKAQQEAYQTWKQAHGPQEYSQFVTQWNQHYDPRVFQAAYMDAPEVAKLKAGMSKAERANFDAFSAFAKSKGWLNGGQ